MKRAQRKYSREALLTQFEQCEALLQKLESSPRGLLGSEAAEIASGYQKLCQVYAALATFYPETAECKRALGIVLRGRRLLYGRRLEMTRGGYRSFFTRVSDGMRGVRGYVALSAFIVLLSGLVTAAMVVSDPNFGWAFVNEQTAEHLSQGKLWTERIRGISSLASSEISTNNIKVSFSAFAFGVTGGVGTLIMLVFNGASLGGLFAVTARYDLAGTLFDFIAAHGFLELSIIFVAAGAGLAVGDAMLSPGEYSRTEAMSRAAKNVLPLLIFSTFCLLPCGVVEGYVSPYPTLPTFIKALIGVAIASIYWSIVLVRPKPN